MKDIVIVDAVRSAVGRAHKGSLANKRPDELLGEVIEKAGARNVAENDLVSAFATDFDHVDVRIDNDERLLMAGQHVGDHLLDAPVASDDRAPAAP